MKERPIPFKGEMVRAILAGTKTQERWLVRNPWPDHFEDPWKRDGRWFVCGNTPPDTLRNYEIKCPHGAVGDRLWVRESGWIHTEMYEEDDGSSLDRIVADFFRYAASPRNGKRRWRGDGEVENITFLDESSPLEQAPLGRSCPSPRWASRIDLEITDVRVQRLHDITEADARAEGIVELAGQAESMRELFAMMWDHINGARSPWDRNDWVWAITFKRLRP
jgi:hypothetical protein